MSNILFYMEIFLIGGRERVIINLLNELNNRGYSSNVIIDFNENKWDIKPIVLSNSTTSFLGRSFLLNNIVRDVDFFISNLVHNNSYLSTHEFVAMLYYPHKFVTICHHKEFHCYLSDDKKLSHYLNSNTKGVVAICDEMKKMLYKYYGFENLTTIYNPNNLQLIQEKSNEPLDENINYKYILAVGRLDPIKNFSALIRAYSNTKLKNENVKLIIVGDGPNNNERKKLKNLINKLGMKDNVILVGNKDNPFTYMKNALFMIMPSKSEGFGMVLVECLATGTPVISYDLQVGPNEIITHEYNGLLVKDQDENELAKAIDRLYFDKKLYEKCKSNSVSSVQKFDSKNIVNSWEVLINKALDENKANDGILKTHKADYVNPHGEFTTQDLVGHIEYILNLDKLLEYIDEIESDNTIIDNFESNVYGLIDRYCFVFKCNDEIKNVIKVNVASNIIIAIEHTHLPMYLKNKLKLKLSTTYHIIDKNDALMSLLYLKNRNICFLNGRIYYIENSKWYKFGQSSRKEKIKKLLKIIANKFLPKYSIRRDIVEIIYKISKLIYKKRSR